MSSLARPAPTSLVTALVQLLLSSILKNYTTINYTINLWYIMKSFAILAALVGSASAFSPAQVSRTSTSVNAMSDMVGGEGPEPMPFSPGQTSVMFDPAGFAEVCYRIQNIKINDVEGKNLSSWQRMHIKKFALKSNSKFSSHQFTVLHCTALILLSNNSAPQNGFPGTARLSSNTDVQLCSQP